MKKNSTVKGSLVINYEEKITSTNGQIYTVSSASVIINTGVYCHDSLNNQNASTNFAKDGYIYVFCGNRGKQDSLTDEKDARHWNTYLLDIFEKDAEAIKPLFNQGQ